MVLGDVVHGEQDVLMTPGRLRQWLYEVHANPFEGDAENGGRDEEGSCWLLRSLYPIKDVG